MTIIDIDHVQLAMPEGREEAARRFYGMVLGLPEVPKPANLAKRGGVWFQAGARQLHLGIEAEFRPARKAHPAFRVVDLPALRKQLVASGYVPKADEPLAGYDRFHVDDPFRNRLEFLEPERENGRE
jgi:catechol 2,3-dioxygenase-like lactoylglutathione lyase family enzyme